MPSEKMPGEQGDDPFSGVRPGAEVVVHQDMPALKREEKHHIVSSHVGAYYGIATNGGVAFVPEHVCSDGDEDGD